MQVDAKVATSSIKIKIIIAMKSLFIASLSAVVVLSSCSVYRQGQTPDDLYYAPGQPVREEGAAYVPADGGRDDGRRYDDQRTYNGYDDYASADDRWLMMRVRNRNRWSYFDDFNYYSPYGFGYNGFGGYGYGGGFGGFSPGFSFGLGGYGMGLGYGAYDPFYSGYGSFNNYYNWNSFYNPYYSKYMVVNPKNDPGAYNRVRNFNLNTYNNRAYNNSRATSNPNLNNRGNSGYNNSNNRTLGNSFRRVFSNSNSQTPGRANGSSNENYRYNNDRPTRTYTPNNNSSNSTYSPRNSGGSSNSGSSSSGSSSSGSRPSRR